MAQYDVYPNPGESSKTGIPLVVVVQSDLLDSLPTRLVIPLATPEFAGAAPDKLCPQILVNGLRLRALAHYAAPLATRQLKKRVDNVALQADVLATALDMVHSRV